MSYQPIISFIRSLYPNKEFIALHEPSFTGNEKKYVAECIDSTYVSSVGPFVGKFEDSVATFVNRQQCHPDESRDPVTLHEGQQCHPDESAVQRGRDPDFRRDDTAAEVRALACVNGTLALHLALIAAGVKAGDEVITQALSFIATANPIVYLGARPIFIDVDPDTLGMSPVALRTYLGSLKGRKYASLPKACVPMHTFGNPCRIDEIVEICNEFNIPVIEDAAESIGSYYKGQHTGTFGTMGILSFNGNKTITTGGGGMIVTSNQQLATTIKHLSTQAKVPHPWEFAHDAIGYNYRLPNINAALGVAQMETIGHKLQSKRLIAQKYFEFFDAMGIRTISEIAGAHSNYWLNGIFLDNRKQRDEFLQAATDQRIQCRPVWNLLPTLPMYHDYPCEPIPNAIRISDTLVNLPSSPG